MAVNDRSTAYVAVDAVCALCDRLASAFADESRRAAARIDDKATRQQLTDEARGYRIAMQRLKSELSKL